MLTSNAARHAVTGKPLFRCSNCSALYHIVKFGRRMRGSAPSRAPQNNGLRLTGAKAADIELSSEKDRQQDRDLFVLS
jgi:hypothetical protein